MKHITSVHNPEIKDVVRLHSSKRRAAAGAFIIEGLRVCQTFVQAGWDIQQWYVTPAALESFEQQVASCEAHGVPITLVDEQVMAKMSQATTPSGILGICSLPDESRPEELTAGLVLVECADPGNAGTLIRTAVALNKPSVIFVGGVDPWSHKVVQATAGMLAYATIFQWSWQEVHERHGSHPLVALVVRDGLPLERGSLQDALFVLGSEAHGLPQEIVAACDQRVTLAMPGGAESLNVAVAGSIALYLAASGVE